MSADIDLRALRELAEAATPGPWGDPAEVHVGDFGWTVFGCPAGETEDSPQGRADAAFIAAANPTAVLALLDRLAAAEAAVERVRALLGEPVGPLLDTFARNKIRAALDGDS